VASFIIGILQQKVSSEIEVRQIITSQKDSCDNNFIDQVENREGKMILSSYH